MICQHHHAIPRPPFTMALCFLPAFLRKSFQQEEKKEARTLQATFTLFTL